MPVESDLSLWCRHWSVAAPHCLARDPWDSMHVANCDYHVFLYSLAHWHVSALSPIRKLSSPPHRRHRQCHFAAGSAAAVGSPDCGSSCRHCCCPRRSSDSVDENLCKRNSPIKENSFACTRSLSLSRSVRLIPFPSFDLLSSCEAVLRHFEKKFFLVFQFQFSVSLLCLWLLTHIHTFCFLSVLYSILCARRRCSASASQPYPSRMAAPRSRIIDVAR